MIELLLTSILDAWHILILYMHTSLSYGKQTHKCYSSSCTHVYHIHSKLGAGCIKAVGTAVDTFLMVLDTHKWTSMPSMAARSRGRSSASSDPAAAASSSETAGPTLAANGAQGGDPSTPPYALMDHAPLAIFVNGLLSAFNELRHCAPLSLASALASILQVRFCCPAIHVEGRGHT